MFEATFGRYLMILECFKDSYMNTTFLHFDIYIYSACKHIYLSCYYIWCKNNCTQAAEVWHHQKTIDQKKCTRKKESNKNIFFVRKVWGWFDLFLYEWITTFQKGTSTTQSVNVLTRWTVKILNQYHVYWQEYHNFSSGPFSR